MDDAAATGQAIRGAPCRGADDKAIGNGVREVTSEDGDRDVGEMRCSATMKDDFVEGV